MKTLFLGTPDFALPALEKLINSDYKPIAVFCAPDKPVGRQQTLTPPPIKILAQKYGLPVYQPADKKELAEQISELKPDIILSAAYGIIIPQEALNIPKLGCLNIHPSLLPKYRGASPIQTAILNGDAKTGITIFKMDANMDTGAIIGQEEYKIENPSITTPELSKILAELGASLLLKILPEYLAEKIKPIMQDDSLASYTKIIKKEDGLINWRKSAKEIDQQIRAYFPWPGTFSQSGQQTLKIIETATANSSASRQIGEIFLDNGNFAVQTGNGALIIKKLQIEGGKLLSAPDFLRGHKDIIGQILK